MGEVLAMRHGTGPGLGWKLFAGLMVFGEAIGDVPKLFHPASALTSVLVALNLVAVSGVVAYAFRQRLGPVGFWRAFAPFFCLVSAGEIGRVLPIIVRLIALTQGSMVMVLGMLFVIVPVLAMAFFTCLALLRQAELLGPSRRPLGRKPDQLSLPLPLPTL